jgi:hypothetical protein
LSQKSNVSPSATRSTTPRGQAPKTEFESSSSRQQSESGLDVTDVPDKVLEALNVVRTLKQPAYDDELPPGRAVELGDEIERLLQQILETMAAAEQLEDVPEPKHARLVARRSSAQNLTCFAQKC